MEECKCYGYVRVSTREQNGDRQLLALRECGILDENVFMDKQSGKDLICMDICLRVIFLQTSESRRRTRISLRYISAMN
ncbi:recombinase family protein [Lachnospiraceae bacterium ZAX-1]